MPEPLKNLYTRELIDSLSQEISAFYREFDTDGFTKKVFGDRWQAAHEQWHPQAWGDAVGVDLGCGPGNLYATLGHSRGSGTVPKPKILIGVDVSEGALQKAKTPTSTQPYL